MIKAIRNKVVTCICSDHNPHSSEDKEKDIKHAPFGTVSLESAFSAIYTELSNNKFSISDIIKLFPIINFIYSLMINSDDTENHKKNKNIIYFEINQGLDFNLMSAESVDSKFFTPDSTSIEIASI